MEERALLVACLHYRADNINPVRHGVTPALFLSAASPTQTWEQTCRALRTITVKSTADPLPGSTSEPRMIKRAA